MSSTSGQKGQLGALTHVVVQNTINVVTLPTANKYGMVCVMALCWAFRIRVPFQTDNFFSCAQDHVPLLHMILAFVLFILGLPYISCSLVFPVCRFLCTIYSCACARDGAPCTYLWLPLYLQFVYCISRVALVYI